MSYRYEYKVIPRQDVPMDFNIQYPTDRATRAAAKEYEEWLNNLGFAGWQLVSVNEVAMVMMRIVRFRQLSPVETRL